MPRLVAALLAISLPPLCYAGPPYLTDDPEPVELRHWEVYLASQATFGVDGLGTTAPHVEVNYGAAPDLQLHVLAPLALVAGGGAPARYGPGDLELGAKYRFLDEDRAGVQLGTFPLVTLPTGSATRGLGEGAVTVFLPLWLQKGFGPWTTYGGGGYRLRAASAASDSWFLGWQLQRRVGPVAVGAEIFHETDGAATLRGDTAFGVGVVADVSELHHLLVSLGAGSGPLSFHAYLGWQLTFGPEGEPARPGEHPER